MKNQEFHETIEKIIDSKSFGRSDTYANLLRYLAKCSLNKAIPKETTIAAEIFGKPEFDPSQSTLIRVYVYNLRKKIANYYQKEGINDSHLIRIPKGGYAIELIERRKEHTTSSILMKDKKWISIFCLSAVCLFFAFLYFSKNTNSTPPVNPNGLWKDIIHSELPTVLVLGDLFIYQEQDTTHELNRTIRDPSINSLEAFEAFKNNYHDSTTTLMPHSYSYLILGSAQWIKQLTEIFTALDTDYSIQTISRFNPKQLQDYTIIAVGMHKTLGLFQHYLKTSHFTYDDKNGAFIYTNGSKNTIVYKPHGNADSYHTDYAYMAKFKGPNNNAIYVFSGLWDTGATQSLKNFTDPKLLKQLETSLKNEFGELPENYEVFFEVNGIDRMELSSKILHLHTITN